MPGKLAVNSQPQKEGGKPRQDTDRDDDTRPLVLGRVHVGECLGSYVADEREDRNGAEPWRLNNLCDRQEVREGDIIKAETLSRYLVR